MRLLFTVLLGFIAFMAVGQAGPGIVVGTVMDEKSRALKAATVQLTALSDSAFSKVVLTDDFGAFRLSNIAYGHYRLKLSYIGFQPLILDSIYFRAERYDFNLNDL